MQTVLQAQTPTYSNTYSNTPAAIPTTARAVAALPVYLIAPPVDEVAEALGVLPDEEPVPDAEALELLFPLASAACWKASKVLAGVGLTAKTIPF